MPKPKGIMPMMGAIQWTCFSAVQPYQKKLIGRTHAKKIVCGSRISHSNFPPFRAVSFTTTWSLVVAITRRPSMNPIPMPR